ncbi:hypothetical protein EDC01DRAFT_776590 [Geopyxis carbonaria]|nr:hypothetical protein EDC01DRAFT_776590 [Geopyxis carbonaria]
MFFTKKEPTTAESVSERKTIDPVIKCKYCDYVCTSASELKEHQKMHPEKKENFLKKMGSGRFHWGKTAAEGEVRATEDKNTSSKKESKPAKTINKKDDDQRMLNAYARIFKHKDF